MHKKVTFQQQGLPYLLVLPQMAITLIFFIWPASQAMYQSLLVEDAFGLSTEFVWFENFGLLFADPTYLKAFGTTIFFSLTVAFSALIISLFLAIMADRIIRLAAFYKTMLIWPYAVAPAIVGVLWLFMLNPTIGIVAYGLKGLGMDWNHQLNGNHAMFMIIIAAVWKQISYNFLFFLAGLQSIPKSLIEAAAIDCAGPGKRFWTIQLPLLAPHHLLFAGCQSGLRLL